MNIKDWKLVPIQATPNMVAAGINTPVVDTGDDLTDQPEDYENVYRSMIEAAPNVEIGEPVYYRCRHSENEPWFFSDRPGYWEWEPLYVIKVK